jgi:hypothetical protein
MIYLNFLDLTEEARTFGEFQKRMWNENLGMIFTNM